VVSQEIQDFKEFSVPLVNLVTLVSMVALGLLVLLVTKEQQVRKVLKVSVDLLVTSDHLEIREPLVILVLLDHQAILAFRVTRVSQEVAELLGALDCLELQDRLELLDLSGSQDHKVQRGILD